jgi:hypothetical protein
MFLLARVIKLVTGLVVAVIVVGIVLHLLDANAGNALVSAVYDVAGWLASPFDNVFKLDDANGTIAVNWGLAALVYAVVGTLIASLIARASVAGRGAWMRRRRGTAEPV